MALSQPMLAMKSPKLSPLQVKFWRLGTRWLSTLLIGLLGLGLPLKSLAGSWSGSGGSGEAYEFIALAELLARGAILEDYDGQHLQMRDQVEMPRFWAAINGVKVVATEEPVFDRDGDPATAAFLTPEEIEASPYRAQWDRKKYPLGLIRFNIDRFENEKKAGLATVLATVFHEFARAMKMPEDQYQKTRSVFNSERMNEILNSNLPLVQSIQRTQQRMTKLRSKFELIESEQSRIKGELATDQQTLDQVIVKRRPFVKAQREAVENMFDSLANVLAKTGMMAPMSHDGAARLTRALGGLTSNQMDLSYKMNELDVMNQQVDFLMSVLQSNRDFYRELMAKRKKIVLDALDE
jgi:hypothetical protein